MNEASDQPTKTTELATNSTIISAATGTAKDDEIDERQKAVRKEKNDELLAKYTRSLRNWTIGLVLVGLLTTGILFLQWRTFEKTDATLKAEQRAWMGTSGIELNDMPQIGKLLTVTVDYQNFGKEPAKSVDFSRVGNFTASVPTNVPPELVPKLDRECSIDGDDVEGRATGETCQARIEKELAACRATETTPSGRVVYPGKGSFPLPIGKGAMRSNINTKERMIVITGCFTYLTFEKVHYSAFCYFYRGAQTPPKAMGLCPFGNDAN